MLFTLCEQAYVVESLGHNSNGERKITKSYFYWASLLLPVTDHSAVVITTRAMGVREGDDGRNDEERDIIIIASGG